MMQIGISSANLYPLTLEDTLPQLKNLGAEVTEVFLNTESEVEPAFLQLLKSRADEARLAIRSLHSYTSCFEPYLLFSAYERRFEDGLRVFARIFAAAATVGADYVILHGDRDPGVLCARDSIRRFERLYDLGRTYGVTLLQENVVRFRASSIAHIRTMREQLGDKAQFTLDFKQCRRTGIAIPDMIEAMRGAIRHVHISDATPEMDCLIPGGGNEDFPALLKQLRESGFDGALIIELYRHNFGEIRQLAGGVDTLRRALCQSKA